MVPSRQHMTRVAGDGVSLGPAGLTGVCHGDYLGHLSGQGRCRSALTKFREPLIECRAVVIGFDIERDAEQAAVTFVDPDARFLVVWPQGSAESRLFLWSDRLATVPGPVDGEDHYVSIQRHQVDRRCGDPRE